MLSVLRTVSVFFSRDNLKSLCRFLAEEATMDSSEFDAVKAEKDVAMRRFNRRRRVKWLFEACAAFFVLAQCSSLWLPIAADLLRETVAIFRSHLFVFALFNSIILAVYALSAGIPRPNDAASGPDIDLYGQSVTNSKRIAAEDESPAPETEKTVISDNAGDTVTPVVQDLTVAELKANNCICTDGGASEKALIVKSGRSASFRGHSSVSDESGREFRRSYTDVRRRLTWCGEEEARRLTRSSAVNLMSDEEFNRRIDDFIATQKWIQQEEYKEERKTERFMALAVCQ